MTLHTNVTYTIYVQSSNSSWTHCIYAYNADNLNIKPCGEWGSSASMTSCGNNIYSHTFTLTKTFTNSFQVQISNNHGNGDNQTGNKTINPGNNYFTLSSTTLTEAEGVTTNASGYATYVNTKNAVTIPEGVKTIGENAFQRCRGAEAGAQGNVARKDGVEAVHLAAALEDFAADAEDVPGPLLGRDVVIGEAELHIFIDVDGENLHDILAVGFDGRHDAKIDGSGEHVTAIVVRMFANEVDSAGRRIQLGSFTKERLELFKDFFFHII